MRPNLLNHINKNSIIKGNILNKNSTTTIKPLHISYFPRIRTFYIRPNVQGSG